MIDEVDIAAMTVRSEAEFASRGDNPEWLSVIAMNYVQARVRGWRENMRFQTGSGFTQYPPAILALGAGYCGSQVVAWRAVLDRLKVETREIGFFWGSRSHVCGEARWGNRWHLFDVSLGTVWVRDGLLLGWHALRKFVEGGGDEFPLRLSNDPWFRWSATWDNPFGYVSEATAVIR